MPRNYLYAGAVAPACIIVTVVPGDTLADLSAITGAEFDIRRRRDGSEETLTGVTIEAQSATALVLKYTCPASSPFPDTDTIRVTPRLLAPEGSYLCAPRVLRVTSV